MLYIFGGKDNSGNLSSDFFILNLGTKSYQNIITKGLSPEGRYDHSSLIYNEKMYIFGGVTDKDKDLQDIWVWNLKFFSGWERLAPRSNHMMGILPASRRLPLVQGFNNSILLFKGETKEGICEDLLYYKANSGQWEDLSLNQKLPFSGEAHLFRVYKDTKSFTNKLLIGQNLNLYELSLDALNKPTNEVPKPKKEELEILEDFESFRNHFKRIYKEKLFTDVAFKVEGEEVPAHKAVLAGRSKYFENMFSSI